MHPLDVFIFSAAAARHILYLLVQITCNFQRRSLLLAHEMKKFWAPFQGGGDAAGAPPPYFLNNT